MPKWFCLLQPGLLNISSWLWHYTLRKQGTVAGPLFNSSYIPRPYEIQTFQSSACHLASFVLLSAMASDRPH